MPLYNPSRKPKPEQIRPGDQPTQLPKRPEERWWNGYSAYFKPEADALFDSKDAKIAELEKAVQVHNDSAVEARQLTRKWQKNVFELEQSCRELEKELRVMRIAAERLALDGFRAKTIAAYGGIEGFLKVYIATARKESNDGE